MASDTAFSDTACDFATDTAMARARETSSDSVMESETETHVKVLAHNRAEIWITELLAEAGIRVNPSAPHPWDLRVHDARFYRRVLADGSLGLGESYMEGWWDCEALDEAVTRFVSKRLYARLPQSLGTWVEAIKAKVLNMQDMRRAKSVAKIHYDLGNDFYADMLDSRMQYTCGYWRRAQNLEEAQEHKLDLICRKLNLQPGMSVLELGCGWGGLSRFMAERYGCKVRAYNISEQQVAFARERNQGLPVEICLQDYRLADGNYDRVVSVGLCEHIGHRNYGGFFGVIHRCLKPGGLALVHTIGGNESVTEIDAWLDKYIFPHAVLPSAAQLAAAIEGDFVLEDWHNLGPDYDKTLMAWQARFAENWHKHEKQYGDPSEKSGDNKESEKGSEKFRRMWEYYLLACAGTFRARMNQLWQIVISKPGDKPWVYEPVR